jgi:hypothetical protein
VQLTGRAQPRNRHRQVAVRYGRGRQSTSPTATFGIPTASSVAWHY